MSGNHPGNTVTVVAEKDKCIYTTTGVQCVSAGEKVLISKQHYAHCKDGISVSVSDSCPDMMWLTGIGAGETFRTEVPATDGTPRSLTVVSSVPLTLQTGTEVKPLSLVEGGVLVKENAPLLLQAGTNVVPLLTAEGEVVNEVALTNCDVAHTKVNLNWTRCL